MAKTREQETEPEEEVAVAVAEMVEEESQVIVHCICSVEAYYRIWPSTFLIEHNSGRRARLITAFNVSFYPDWTPKEKGQKFTLVFEGLSRSCVVFDLREVIPESDGFEVNNIVRNNTDIYTVEIG